jgi:hypothetical protein
MPLFTASITIKVEKDIPEYQAEAWEKKLKTSLNRFCFLNHAEILSVKIERKL